MSLRGGKLTLLFLAVAVALSGGTSAHARTLAQQLSAPLAGAHTFRLERAPTHVAVHWRGAPHARVRVAFSRDGRHFGRPRTVVLDELAEARRSRETYGALLLARGARAVRVYSARRLARVTVVALTDRGGGLSLASAASVSQPAVIARAGWGADESLRFDSTGKEVWPPAFWPVQKLIVHHTATQNNDPNPAATIRSIYYYHAVTQGWGDIGYNFLIDESGRVYEGRYSRQYAPGESPTGEDLAGKGVAGAHAQGFNSGTVGIALLGTLSNQDATPAARQALEQLLAWEAQRHGIDPLGSALYTNPVSGTQATFPNIAGHRDVNATECPGGVFYATLPTIRSDVAALIAGPQPADFTLGVAPASVSVGRGKTAVYSVSVGAVNGFAGTVAFSVSGVPAGATAAFNPTGVTGGETSTLSVTTSRSTPPGKYALSIRGTSGATTHTVGATLQIKSK